MRQTDWKKIEFPYKTKDEKKMNNFRKFIEIGDFDLMTYFNFGNDFYRVARGENPRYNPEIKPKMFMNCTFLTHSMLFRNSQNGDTILVCQPEKYIKEQLEQLKLLREFGKEYGVTGLIKDTNTKNICFYPSETDKRFIIIGLPEIVEKYKNSFDLWCENSVHSHED